MNLFDKVIGRIDKIVFVFMIGVLSFSFYFIYTLNQSYSKKQALQSLDNALFLTRNLLEEEEHHALSLSLLLSQDKTFLEAFYTHDRKKTFEIIHQKIASLKKLQGCSVEVQVHDASLHTYLRSWDYAVQGVPLASFRQGLVRVKKSQKPLVSIEVGKRLNIKAISPILKNGKFQGSIEVIENFEHLRKKLSEHGYALFILLNKKYLNIATTLKHNPVVLQRYVLVNEDYDKHSFASLKKFDMSNLKSSGYFTQDNHAFAYFSIKNFENIDLGYFVIVFENSTPLMLKTKDEITRNKANSSGVIIQ